VSGDMAGIILLRPYVENKHGKSFPTSLLPIISEAGEGNDNDEQGGGMVEHMA